MADHEVKIKISGDEKPAVNAFKRVISSLQGVQRVASSVMRALGIFGLAVNGVQALAHGFKFLYDKVNEARTATIRLNNELSRNRAEKQVERHTKAYDKLTASIKKAADAEKLRQESFNTYKSNTRASTDAQLELQKQQSLASLDPSDPNYAALKAQITSSYDQRTKRTAAARGVQDAELKAKDLQAQADNATATSQKFYGQLWLNQQLQHRNISPETKKGLEAEEKELTDLHDKARQNASHLITLAKLAQEEVDAAKARQAALEEQIKIEDREAAEHEKAKECEVEREKIKKQHELEDAKLNHDEQIELNMLDPSDKDYETQKKNVIERFKRARLVKNIERESDPTEKAIRREELATYDSQDAVATREEEARKLAESRARKSEFTARLAGVSQLGKDRLTSIGLSSGNIVDRSAQQQLDQLKKLVELGQKQLDATKNNQQSSTGTFAP